MLSQARERGRERIDEARAEAPRGPGLELPEVEVQTDDREARVQGRADVNGAVKNAHGSCSCNSFS